MLTFSSLLHRVSKFLPDQINGEGYSIKDNEAEFIYNLPKNYEEISDIKMYYNLPGNIGVTKAFLLKDVLISQGGIVFKDFNFFVPSLPEPWLVDHVKYTILLKQWFTKKRVLKEQQVGLVFDQWSAVNYYHWIFDSLPRLLLLRDNFPGCKLLLPYPTPTYIKKTASLLGFDEFLPIKYEDVIQVENLVVIQHTSPPKFHSPIMVKRLRAELLQALNINLVGEKKRVYISRSKQVIRKLLNENDVLPILAKYNFEMIYFEDMSFEQQVQLMNSASIIVSTHGANLTNILFAAPGTAVVEMHNKKTDNFLYFRICSYLKLNYYSVACEATHYEDNDGDLKVDVNYLEEIIGRAITTT